MSEPLVTILVPNYKTLELTKLCLRLIRKYTDHKKVKVMVVDNDSRDESLAYLKNLAWIELVERTPVPGETPPQSHSRALDLLLEKVTTPYVLSIHTDTLVKNKQWLDFLIAQIEARPTIAGVGSWKLEFKPFWQRWFKMLEKPMQMLYYRCRGKTIHTIEGVGDNYYYLRSHCAMYRTELLKQFGLGFSDGDAVAGKVLHKKLIDEGFEMIFLPSETLIQFVDHINHATAVLNPTLGIKQKELGKGLRRIQKNLEQLNASEILRDSLLDY